MKQNKITVETLLSWNPCCSFDGEKYCEAELRKKIGDGKTPLEVSRMWSVPLKDRIWVLLRPEVLGEDNLKSVLDEIADYHVERSCLDCGITEVEKWAKGWLGGEDRTSDAAWSAARSAWSAAESATDYAARSAAEYAAWSAEYAAWSAGWSAWSAVESAAEYARFAGVGRRKEEKRQLGIIRKYLRRID